MTGGLFIGIIPFLGSDSEDGDEKVGEFDSDNFDDIASQARFQGGSEGFSGQSPSPESGGLEHGGTEKMDNFSDDQGDSQVQRRDDSGGGFGGNSEWSRAENMGSDQKEAAQEADRPEVPEMSFNEKVKEAREEIQEAGQGNETESHEEDGKWSRIEKIARGGSDKDKANDNQKRVEEESAEEVEEPEEEVDSVDEDADEQADEGGKISRSRIKELEEELDDLKSSEKDLPSQEELEEMKSHFEDKTEKIEEMLPSWDDLGTLEGRDDESILVKADIEALSQKIESEEADSEINDRIEELQQRMDGLEEMLDQRSSGDETDSERLEELDQKVEDIHGELRGEEIELRNRIEELEEDLKAVRSASGSESNDQDPSEDFHNQAMREEVRELRQNVRDLSSAVVEISQKVFNDEGR